MGVQFPGKKRYVTLEWPLWIRNKSVRTEIGQILRAHTHTHTTAAKLVVRMWIKSNSSTE